MLGEDDELLARGGLGRRNVPGSVFGLGLLDPGGQAGGREDLVQKTCQLPPFGVVASVQYVARQPFEPPQGVDFRTQLPARLSGGGLVQHLGFRGLGFILGDVFQVLQVFQIQLGTVKGELRLGTTGPEELFQLLKPGLEAPSAPAQGPVDRRGRRCETALEDRQREPDGRPLFASQGVRAIELLLHILSNRVVQRGLGLRESVGDGVGPAHREERCAVELQQLLLDHASHQVGGVGTVNAGTETALEPVAVEQRHEELEVVLLAVVGRRRHEQKVAGEAAK